MRLLVCAYEDVDAERALVDELSDLDEAVACCRDLVESEGYPRAEIWVAAGRRLFVVVRDGDAIYEGELPDEASLFESPRPAHAPHAAPPNGRRAGPTPSSRNGGAPAAANGATTERGPAVAPPSPPADPPIPPRPAGLLGEQPESGELWFGL